jgi:hypothetical protein
LNSSNIGHKNRASSLARILGRMPRESRN